MTMYGLNVGNLFQIISIAFITSLYSTTLLAGEIRAWIDEPEPNEIYTGIATIRGWAVGSAGIKRVETYYDGEYRTDIPIGGSRKDVGAVYPEYPDSDKSGFSMAFGYSNDNGAHVVTIKLTDNEGDQKEFSSAFTTTGFESGFIHDPRDIDISTITDFIINNGNSLTLEGVDFRGEKQDVRLDWLTPRQNFTITSILPSDSGAVPSLDGVYSLSRLTFWFGRLQDAPDGLIFDTEAGDTTVDDVTFRITASGTLILNGSESFNSMEITFYIDGLSDTLQEEGESTIIADDGYALTTRDSDGETTTSVMLKRGTHLIIMDYLYDDPDDEDAVVVHQWQKIADSATDGATIQQLSQISGNNSSSVSGNDLAMKIKQAIRDSMDRVTD